MLKQFSNKELFSELGADACHQGRSSSSRVHSCNLPELKRKLSILFPIQGFLFLFYQKMEGVVAYFDHKSIPRQNHIMPTLLEYDKIEELFCSGQVVVSHQPIGLIVAESHTIAVKAASKVRVFYSTPQEKPLLSPQDLLKANATDRIEAQTTIVASRRG